MKKQIEFNNIDVEIEIEFRNTKRISNEKQSFLKKKNDKSTIFKQQ